MHVPEDFVTLNIIYANMQAYVVGLCARESGHSNVVLRSIIQVVKEKITELINDVILEYACYLVNKCTAFTC